MTTCAIENTSYMFSSSYHSALVTCCPALTTEHRLHVLPRLPQCTGYMFSRAYHRLHVSHAYHQWYVFPHLQPGTRFPAFERAPSFQSFRQWTVFIWVREQKRSSHTSLTLYFKLLSFVLLLFLVILFFDKNIIVFSKLQQERKTGQFLNVTAVLRL